MRRFQRGERIYKARTIGGKCRYKVSFLLGEGRREGWMVGKRLDKRAAREKEAMEGGGKKNDCHEIKKNEWLYLSVIKTVPKNKQTRGNKPRARL